MVRDSKELLNFTNSIVTEGEKLAQSALAPEGSAVVEAEKKKKRKKTNRKRKAAKEARTAAAGL